VLIGFVIEGELCLCWFEVECEPAPLPVPVLVLVPLPASAVAPGVSPPKVAVAVAPEPAAPVPTLEPVPAATPDEVSLGLLLSKVEEELFFEGGVPVLVVGALTVGFVPVGCTGGTNGVTF
jgi:hypothetical protein